MLECGVMQLGWLEFLKMRTFIMWPDENHPKEFDLLLITIFKERKLQLSRRWIFMFDFG